ncbi:MAG: STAS domain-containing protein [Planctomycetota bacterium]
MIFGKKPKPADAGPTRQAFETPRCRAEVAGTAAIARIRVGFITETETTPLLADLEKAAAESPGLKLAIDLADVEALASAGIGMLVRLHQGLKAKGGRVTLFNTNDQLLEMLKIARMDKLLDFKPSEQNAIAALG